MSAMSEEKEMAIWQEVATLQCSCLENPRDGGAWWTAVYGVAQSRTRLKLLSSSKGRGFGKWNFLYLSLSF